MNESLIEIENDVRLFLNGASYRQLKNGERQDLSGEHGAGLICYCRGTRVRTRVRQ